MSSPAEADVSVTFPSLPTVMREDNVTPLFEAVFVGGGGGGGGGGQNYNGWCGWRCLLSDSLLSREFWVSYTKIFV